VTITQQVCKKEWAIWISNEKTCKNFKNAIQEKPQQGQLEKRRQTTTNLEADQIQSNDFLVAGQA
jgi:hypothetical protein